MPRLQDNGCFFTVSISKAEVIDWASRWPCFGPRRALWFQFDKRNDNLVDMIECHDNDDSGILALSHDAQAWGLSRLHGKPIAFGKGQQ